MKLENIGGVLYVDGKPVRLQSIDKPTSVHSLFNELTAVAGGAMRQLLGSTALVPPDWAGKVVIFGPDGNDDDDKCTNVPALTCWNDRPIPGHVLPGTVIDNQYGVAVFAA